MDHSVMYAVIYAKGWPWRRPPAGTLTDTSGRVYTHDETWWQWLRWRWVSQYKRVTDSASGCEEQK